MKEFKNMNEENLNYEKSRNICYTPVWGEGTGQNSPTKS
jgi:hypothetical protein